MNIGAVGAINGIGYGPLAGLSSIGAGDTATIGRLVSSLQGANHSMGQFLDAVNASTLPPGTKVTISDAAQALTSLNGNASDSSYGELAQALIVALILQLLAPGATS